MSLSSSNITASNNMFLPQINTSSVSASGRLASLVYDTTTTFLRYSNGTTWFTLVDVKDLSVAIKTSSQSITGTDTVVTGFTIDPTTGVTSPNFNTSAGTYTVPASGNYRISCTGLVAIVLSITGSAMTLTRNSTSSSTGIISASRVSTGALAAATHNLSATVQLVAGDVLRLIVSGTLALGTSSLTIENYSIEQC